VALETMKGLRREKSAASWGRADFLTGFERRRQKCIIVDFRRLSC
jgi:hypothetical protein